MKLENVTAREMGTTAAPALCVCSDPNECFGNTLCPLVTQCYSSLVKTGDGTFEEKRGCLHDRHDQYVINRMTCSIKQPHIVEIKCCQTHLCNAHLKLKLTPLPIETPDTIAIENTWFGNLPFYLAIFIPIAVVLLLIFLIMMVFRRVHKKRMDIMSVQEKRLLDDDDSLRVTQVGDSTLQAMMEQSCTSGSGSGLPFLVHRTVARQISLVECIGKGKYGEVWRGQYHGENVAVKIFSSRDEVSWARETEIYNTVMLRHDNILGYLASDMTSRHSCTQLWLICHYHEYGSLYDYLNLTTLSCDQMLLIAHSAAAGLVHLHTEIFGKHGKPSIAHRDIKSKNILVQKNGTCCIGDLGLSVIDSETGSKLNTVENNKVGTKRYMAPEILEETLDPYCFDSFKRVDVYAFGLVLWEICRRCKLNGFSEEYRCPFHDVVPNDPSFEDMHKVVAVDQQRPVIPNRWSTDEVLIQMTKLMKECWYQNSAARLTMLRVKKTLQKHMSQLAWEKKC